MNNENNQDIGLKFLKVTMFQYFNYSVFTGVDNGKLQETFLTNSESNWGVLPEFCNTPEKIIEYIKEISKKDCISDVVLSILYTYTVTEQGYNDMKKLFPKESDDEIKLRILKNLFFLKDTVRVSGAFPIILKDMSKKIQYC